MYKSEITTLYNIPSWKEKKCMLYYSQGKGDTDEQVNTWRPKLKNNLIKPKVFSNGIKHKFIFSMQNKNTAKKTNWNIIPDDITKERLTKDVR